MRRPESRALRVALPAGLLTVLVVVGLAASWPGMRNDWFWDDLHMVREYSTAELAETWHGHYDIDRIETPGYRPLLTLSDHVKAVLFGERAWPSRVVAVLCSALGLLMLGLALRRVGVPLVVSGAAALLTLTSKAMTYTITWVSDSYHANQFVVLGFVFLAAISAGFATGRRRTRWLTASAIGFGVTLLFKEQVVQYVPILVLSPVALDALSIRSRDGVRALWHRIRDDRAVLGHGIALVTLSLVDVVLRQIFVPNAYNHPSRYAPREILQQFEMATHFAGPAHHVYWAGVAVTIAGIVATFVAARRTGLDGPVTRRRAMLALLALLASSLVTASVYARSDLSTMTQFAYACLLVLSVWSLATMIRSRVVAWGFVTLAVAAGVGSMVVSAQASADIQRAMSPWSVQTLALDYQMVHGSYGPVVTIPRGRLADIRAKLRAVGYDKPGIYEEQVLVELYCHAKSHDGRSPAGHRVLVPRELAFEDEDLFRTPVCPAPAPS